MDKETIEALRKMQELNYRQLDSSAIVVVEMGEVDYTTNETIRKYMNNGYKLLDTNRFGVGPLQCGEFLVFVKDE
jgi:hypothetical protein